jgi:hypothetical protein
MAVARVISLFCLQFSPLAVPPILRRSKHLVGHGSLVFEKHLVDVGVRRLNEVTILLTQTTLSLGIPARMIICDEDVGILPGFSADSTNGRYSWVDRE